MRSVSGKVERRREARASGSLVDSGAMPILETARGPVTISAETCDALLDKIRHLESAQPAVEAFRRGGLGHVELDTDGKRLVVDAISLMDRADVEADPQLTKLRDYLIAELTGADG